STYLEGTPLVAAANLAYPAASAYTITAQGSRFVTFEATSTPGASIAALTASLDAATDTTIVLTGFAGSLTPVPLHDFQFPPTNSNNTRLRIVNASPDAPAVDVLVNTTRQATGLAFSTASPYVEIANGTYSVTFNNSATGATILTVGGISLSGA